MIFKCHGKKRYNAKRMKEEGEPLWLLFKSMYASGLVWRAYLKFLSVITSIQCCWRKVLAIREFWRLKQEATKVATNPIQDSRVNVLEEGGKDTVQPCDTTQVRSDLDFGVKSATVLVYGNSHNSQSDRWIRLKFYVVSPDMVSYYGLKWSIEVRKGTTILVNRGCTNFVIYFHLTCGLPIWLEFFSYKDVAVGFGNFLIPKGSLMSCNIISKCNKDSLMFQNLFLIRIPYSS